RIAPPSVHVTWAANEKVALDVGVGASLGGARALVTMKHVGLNVAMDSLMTSPLMGVGAGLVVLSADDPGMHSSQNEQDSRLLARFAGVPLFEPADSQEAYELVQAALQLSEDWDTPCLLRTTTRTSHARSRVVPGPAVAVAPRPFARQARKYVMLPAHARVRHLVQLERLPRLREWVETHAATREEMRDREVGVVASGMAYHYVREVLPTASVLKLGITFPLPVERIRRFAGAVQRLLVVEELEPYLEDEIRGLGLAVEGKRWFPRAGELSPELVREGLQAAGILEAAPEATAPAAVALRPRPPVLCAGCSHATPFLVLRELGAVVHGDIGCYTLAATEPLAAMDTCLAMGSSIGMAVGMARAGSPGHPVVATIGDSTFFHSGMPALLEAVHSQADITVVILDNGITAMTGGQPTPASGSDIRGHATPRASIPDICRAFGVTTVMVVDPYDLGATRRALRAAVRQRGVSVVVTSRACVEAPVKNRGRVYTVATARCDGCQLCMNLGCPALLWDSEQTQVPRRVWIDPQLCSGCTVCAQLCPQEAILPTAAVEPEPVGAAGGRS
ncbi:MAG TPA: thiamine pyrophosphate-dependent enzyme, partial [Candidatus Dormibacteraeota bacterium]|nr:thiamine pyrophosphate-dependent enzyme [Candidatus Dormibacteraeota bacterium]